MHIIYSHIIAQKFTGTLFLLLSVYDVDKRIVSYMFSLKIKDGKNMNYLVKCVEWVPPERISWNVIYMLKTYWCLSSKMKYLISILLLLHLEIINIIKKGFILVNGCWDAGDPFLKYLNQIETTAKCSVKLIRWRKKMKTFYDSIFTSKKN